MSYDRRFETLHPRNHPWNAVRTCAHSSSDNPNLDIHSIMNQLTFRQFQSEVGALAGMVQYNDHSFFAYAGKIRVKWDRAGCYADVYAGDELIHDGCDLKQAIRYLKTQ